MMLKQFYRRYIYPYDPARTSLKQAIYFIIRYLERILDTFLSLEEITGLKIGRELRERLASPLAVFRQATGQAFTSLARALAESSAPRDFPPLGRAYTGVRDAVHQAKDGDQSFEVLLDIATILWHLKILTDELESIQPRVKRLVTG